MMSAENKESRKQGVRKVNSLKKWWGTALPVITAGFYFFLPAFQAWAINHPKSVVGSLLAVIVAAHVSTAPGDREVVSANAQAVEAGEATIPVVK